MERIYSLFNGRDIKNLIYVSRENIIDKNPLGLRAKGIFILFFLKDGGVARTQPRANAHDAERDKIRNGRQGLENEKG